jgi:hypothetical protein
MRKLGRSYCLSVALAFIAILIVELVQAAPAQTLGGGQWSAQLAVVSAQQDANAPVPALERRTLQGPAEGSPVGSQQGESLIGAMEIQNPLFMPAVLYDSGGGAFSVAVADVNGDGKPDLLVANYNSGTVGVLLGNGDGTFRPTVTYDCGGPDNPVSIAVADLNGDGKPDIALTVVVNGTPRPALRVLLGYGDGTFQVPVAYDPAAFNPYQVVIADVNGDSKLDLVVADEFLVSVLLGNGDGTFQVAATYGHGGSYGHSLAVADVNGDGKQDLVVANGGSVGVLLGNGDGTFLSVVTYPTGGGAFWVAVADVNGDGKPDAVVANDGTVGVLLGNGNGTFKAPMTYSSGGEEPWGVGVADVNGDGKPDALVTNARSGSVGVLLGNGDGTFQASVTYASGAVSLSVVATDVNGDGKPDLVAADLSFCNCWNEGGVALLLSGSGTRGPTTTTATANSNPLALNETVTYAAIVRNESGGTATGTVTFRDGSKPIAIVGLVGNQAAWSTSYAKTGVHSITAEYPGDANNTGSSSATLTEHIVALLPVWSTTRVATSGSPSFVAQPVTFVARVTSTLGAIPDGELITFYDGTTALASVALAGGTASYTTSALSAKTHAIKATYAGDTRFLPSTGRVTQIVVKYPTTTGLVSNPDPSAYAHAVIFTATVTPAGPFPPTGKVWFKDGTTGIGTGTLTNGVATLTKKWLAVGTHPITAQYLGDSYSDKSTSSVVNQVVQ